MKFILGYVPGSKSTLHPGPKLIWHIVARHGSKDYEFDRAEYDIVGGKRIYKPKLNVYNSEDYPDALIENLLHFTQIVEWDGDKLMRKAE